MCHCPNSLWLCYMARDTSLTQGSHLISLWVMLRLRMFISQDSAAFKWLSLTFTFPRAPVRSHVWHSCFAVNNLGFEKYQLEARVHIGNRSKGIINFVWTACVSEKEEVGGSDVKLMESNFFFHSNYKGLQV